MSGSDSGATRIGAKPNVQTLTAGYTLVNGTGNILLLSTPNDGLTHIYTAVANKNVTVNETGGQIQVTWTAQGIGQTQSMFTGSATVGSYNASQPIAADPGTFVILKQSTALTLGTSVLIAAITGG